MKRYLFWLLLTVSGILYISISYYTERVQFLFLFIQVTVLFTLFISIWHIGKSNPLGVITLKTYQLSAIALRVLLLFSIPNLSDDFNRFLWDGQLTNVGLNPYLVLPDLHIGTSSISELQNVLFNGLNSKSYFTIYPPLNQYMFATAAWLFPSNLVAEIIVLKLFILLAEIITIFSLPGLLNLLNLRIDLSYLYLFNPLVIIESAGNLHFEIFTVCFLCLSYIFLLKSAWIKSSVLFGLAMSVKFIPLIVLPMLIRYLGFKRGIIYSIVSFIVFFTLFVPFYNNQILSNVFSSVELYFQSFEFNASVYFVIRYIGFLWKGYNIIQSAGLVLAGSTFIFVIVLFFRQKSADIQGLFKMSFFTLLIFYLLSTTVHPWYVINVLFFALLTRYHISVLSWTFLIFLSYSAYMSSEYSENIFLVAFEYVVFVSLFLYELLKGGQFQLKSTNL